MPIGVVKTLEKIYIQHNDRKRIVLRQRQIKLVGKHLHKKILKLQMGHHVGR